MPFGASFLILLIFTLLGATSTLVAWVFSALRPLVPYAWRMWLWGTIGLVAANALLIATLIPMLNGLAIAHGPPPSGDLRTAVVTDLVILGPIVASVAGVLLGAWWGFRLANRRPDNDSRSPTAPVGGNAQATVRFTFGTHVSAETVATWLTTIGACGIVGAVEGSERSYVVTVRRAGAPEYLETLLSEGERRGVLARQNATP